MLMGFMHPERSWNEAVALEFDGRVRLENYDNGLAVRSQETSVAKKDEKTIQVQDKSVEDFSRRYMLPFKRDREAMSPKSTVCRLDPGKYLSCGIGLQNFGDGYLSLTSVDVRRWELCASAISEILKTTSPRDIYNPADAVKIDILDDFLRERQLANTFAIHIPNLRKDVIDDIRYGYVNLYDSVLEDTKHLFLYLLRFFIPLTAAYGGIHLSAWNFEFPSRVESVIWRTACFIIIGGGFAWLAVPIWEHLDDYFGPYPFSYDDRGMLVGTREHRPTMIIMRALNKWVGYGLAGLLLPCYAASRIYLVVESFISLRHVPIGVYAAVPWVENIPHV